MALEARFRDLISGRTTGLLAGFLRGCLALLEPLYGWVIARRNRRFDRGHDVQRVAAPVINIGNLTVGGTGKTPFVAWLARWLLDRNVPVTIISRGYGAQNGQPND
jgi:tetraacyldisaccharide 4'-kinase